jgi:hypothetical protein
MEQRTSASVIHALKPIHGHRGDDRRPASARPMTSRPTPGARASRPTPRNGVRPAVTARGRALLAQQRRAAA